MLAKLRVLGVAAGSHTRPLARSHTSFIAKAAALGGKSLIGPFPTNLGKFDQVLKNVHIDRMDEEEVECSFVVDESCANSYGTLHGGFIATLVDVVGTLALIAKQQDKAGVSVDLNVTYVSAVRVGERVKCLGTVLKMGNSLGFTNVNLVRHNDDQLIACGRHTKAFAKKKHSP